MFEIYKPGQGKWARYLAAGAAGALNIYGCYSLYNYLGGGSRNVSMLFTIPGVDLNIDLPFLVSFGLFLLISFLMYFFMNKAKIADFLVETELEMKKVNWPGRSELVGSSTIVIITVIIFAVVILVFDFAVQWFVRLLYRIG